MQRCYSKFLSKCPASYIASVIRAFNHLCKYTVLNIYAAQESYDELNWEEHINMNAVANECRCINLSRLWLELNCVEEKRRGEQWGPLSCFILLHASHGDGEKKEEERESPGQSLRQPSLCLTIFTPRKDKDCVQADFGQLPLGEQISTWVSFV